MGATVHIPAPLRPYAGDRERIELSADRSVGRLLAELAERYPVLRERLFTEAGELRHGVDITLNNESIRDLGGVETEVSDGDSVSIVGPAAAGAELSPEELTRYSRHIMIPQVGREGQERLKHGSALLVGAGGLGTPLALYLTAAGVGRIGLVDFDTIEESNLHRQVMYGTSDVGRPKLEVAAERLRDLNPHVEIEPIAERLTSGNALRIFADYDVVADGTDNFPTRYLVNDACVLSGKPNVYASIYRFEGQISVFSYDGGPCYRCLYSEPPPPGLVPSCAEGGVLGVLPGVMGGLQANEVIKILLGAGDVASGRLVLYDALRLSFREFTLQRNRECPVCGDEPTVTGLIDYEEFCGLGGSRGGQAVEEIDVDRLKERLDRGDGLILIDVRQAYEREINRIDGSMHIPLGALAERIADLDPRKEYVVYCKAGPRSARAVSQMNERGFSEVANLAGGIDAWIERIDPGLRRY